MTDARTTVDTVMAGIIAPEEWSVAEAWRNAQRQLRDAALAIVTARDNKVGLRLSLSSR